MFGQTSLAPRPVFSVNFVIIAYFMFSGDRDIQSLKVKCSNQEGGCSWEGELREMLKHVSDCTTELIPCKYASIGCKAKVLKKNLPSHEDACTVQHLKMAVEKVNSLTERLKAMELKSHATAINVPPVVFKMSRFTHHKGSKIVWDSPPFYTHARGYKLYLLVNTFGTDHHGRPSISVTVCLHHGEHDNDLVWPFRGVVNFMLLNQENNVSHKYGAAKFLERRESPKNERVGVAQGRSLVGWGVNNMALFSDADFLSHVQNDCLYIRVSDVDVALSNKPWLI